MKGSDSIDSRKESHDNLQVSNDHNNDIEWKILILRRLITGASRDLIDRIIGGIIRSKAVS
jgi:hypothetical protein